MAQRFTLAIALVALVLPLTMSAAQTTNSPAQSQFWQGYERLNLHIAGRPALLVKPKTPAPGNPWIWRTEFFGAFASADVALLADGWHVAYIQVSNMYGSPSSVEIMQQFYRAMTQDYGLSKKPVLEGFSRGGLYAVNFAATYPDQVAALYLDAPVLNIRSWPGGKGTGKGDPKCWEQAMHTYGLTEQTASSFRGNPLDHLEPIARAGIPIIAVCGDADKTVPLDENTALLEPKYKGLGGTITVILKSGCDHHPHSLTDPKPIVDFLIEHFKESNKISSPSPTPAATTSPASPATTAVPTH